MSNISDIFDAIDAKLDAVFGSTHKKMINPYVTDENDNKILNRGYGFYIANGFNTNRNLSCQLSLERQLVVKNTIINRGKTRDIDFRETAEKLLLEDQFLLIKELDAEPTIQEKIARFQFESDNGIEFIFTDRYNYLQIESVFNLEYFENLT